jgi:capsular polysaccharide biosynthesis protein
LTLSDPFGTIVTFVQPSGAFSGGIMESEIDLRPFFSALLRQWRTIAIIILVAAIGAGLVGFMLPPSYTASADVLILPSRSQLTFDSRFVTSNTVPGTDAPTRRQALVAMASSPALETEVLPKIPQSLVDKDYHPGQLARRIRVVPEGDLLHIEASAADEQSAQALADAWAQAYVRTINQLYSQSNDLLKELETQFTDAQQRYNQAQHNLESFISSSTIVQISQQISMTTDLLNESQIGTQKLYAQYLEQARALEATLHDTETLRQQIAAGQTEGLANNLTALALRARAAGNVKLPIDLRFDDPNALTQSETTLADLDILLGVLRQRRDALMEQSRLLAQAIDEGESANAGLPTALLAAYTQRLSQLNQQYEQQTAQMKYLELRRNLALDSLSILQRKLDEQSVALGAPEVQVRFISTAVEPASSAFVRAVVYAALLGFIALLVSVLIVLGQTLLQSRLEPQQLQPHTERQLDQPSTS